MVNNHQGSGGGINSRCTQKKKKWKHSLLVAMILRYLQIQIVSGEDISFHGIGEEVIHLEIFLCKTFPNTERDTENQDI